MITAPGYGDGSGGEGRNLAVSLEKIDYLYFVQIGSGEWLTPSEYFDRGGGHWNEFELSVLLLVRAAGPKGEYVPDRFVSVEILEGDETVVTKRFELGYFGIEEGLHTIPILLHPPLCRRILVRAALESQGGEIGEPEELELVFRCGE